jgi:hypothetical protein
MCRLRHTQFSHMPTRHQTAHYVCTGSSRCKIQFQPHSPCTSDILVRSLFLSFFHLSLRPPYAQNTNLPRRKLPNLARVPSSMLGCSTNSRLSVSVVSLSILPSGSLKPQSTTSLSLVSFHRSCAPHTIRVNILQMPLDIVTLSRT